VPVQAPLVQNCPNSQALPHAPQLKGSMDVRTQAVTPSNGQAVVGGGHVIPASMTVPVQLPFEQNCPKPQARPQAPQLVGSMDVLTQAVIPLIWQAVVPGGHVIPASMAVPVQVPLEQNCPNAQALPHAPQFVGSMEVLMQAVTPLIWQAVVPVGHVIPASMAVPVQVPLEQNCPNPQVRPHAPQLVGSMDVLTQAVIPLTTQVVVPGGHVIPASMAVPVQAPFEQNCPSAQALPQAPQLVGSMDVMTQAVTPSNGQAVVPGGHVTRAFPCVVDRALLGGSLVPEQAASAIEPTTEAAANVPANQRANQRQGIRSSVIALSPFG
jgi:hypothetical protein